jgi:putative transposase
MDWDVSIRRACRVLEFDTSSYQYKSRRPDQAGLEARIKEICATRVRYGYRRVHVLLCRDGWNINVKKAYRIYSELGLQLRKKPPKRRVKAKLRDDRKPATEPSETWAMDFVHDQLATGRKIRVLTVVDTFARFRASAIGPRMSCRRWNAHAPGPPTRRRSASIRAQNSCRAIWIFGLMRKASPWTFLARANPRTMRSSKLSTVASGPSA